MRNGLAACKSCAKVLKMQINPRGQYQSIFQAKQTSSGGN
jgi:hypothetical protein